MAVSSYATATIVISASNVTYNGTTVEAALGELYTKATEAQVYKNTLIEGFGKANIEIFSDPNGGIGYYADIEGDGTVDGIIYADLAFDVTNGQWGNSAGNYSYNAISGLKKYYISQQSYTYKLANGNNSAFGTRPVLSPLGGGKDRFYVMALTNKQGSYSTYYWYFSAHTSASTGVMSDYSSFTSIEFGSGRANTMAMMTRWKLGKNGGYGAQNTRDLWNAIGAEVSDGWFIPSQDELRAFGGNLGITTSLADWGLTNYLYSSTQIGDGLIYLAKFSTAEDDATRGGWRVSYSFKYYFLRRNGDITKSHIYSILS